MRELTLLTLGAFRDELEKIAQTLQKGLTYAAGASDPILSALRKYVQPLTGTVQRTVPGSAENLARRAKVREWLAASRGRAQDPMRRMGEGIHEVAPGRVAGPVSAQEMSLTQPMNLPGTGDVGYQPWAQLQARLGSARRAQIVQDAMNRELAAIRAATPKVAA